MLHYHVRQYVIFDGTYSSYNFISTSCEILLYVLLTYIVDLLICPTPSGYKILGYLTSTFGRWWPSCPLDYIIILDKAWSLTKANRTTSGQLSVFSHPHKTLPCCVILPLKLEPSSYLEPNTLQWVVLTSTNMPLLL